MVKVLIKDSTQYQQCYSSSQQCYYIILVASSSVVATSSYVVVVGVTREKIDFRSFASLATIFHMQVSFSAIRGNPLSDFQKKHFLTVILSVTKILDFTIQTPYENLTEKCSQTRQNVPKNIKIAHASHRKHLYTYSHCLIPHRRSSHALERSGRRCVSPTRPQDLHLRGSKQIGYKSMLYAAFDCASTVNDAFVYLINHLFVYVWIIIFSSSSVGW